MTTGGTMTTSPSLSTDRTILKTRLKMALRSLAILETQAAAYTALTRPTNLQIDLEEKRAEVAALEAQLKGAAAPAPDPSGPPPGWRWRIIGAILIGGILVVVLAFLVSPKVRTTLFSQNTPKASPSSLPTPAILAPTQATNPSLRADAQPSCRGGDATFPGARHSTTLHDRTEAARTGGLPKPRWRGPRAASHRPDPLLYWHGPH
jgi:hypothetical protein